MNIRVFEFNDINDCSNDFLQTFNSPPWNESWVYEHAHEYINDVFNHPKFVGFVLTDNNENIAYAMCYKRYWWSEDDRYELYTELFFVKPTYQQKGYGGTLLEHLEEYAANHDLRGIVLTTKVDMNCYQFYNNKGFSDIRNLVILGKWTEINY